MPKLALVPESVNICPTPSPSAASSDRVFDLLTGWAAIMEIGVCLTENIHFNGEKVTGLYRCRDGRRMIYLDKRLRGRELCFTLMHELAHAILHAGKLGLRYREDADYRKQLESEADNYAQRILTNLERNRAQGVG